MAASDKAVTALPWGQVTARHDRIVIVAGGSSLRRLHFASLERAARAGAHVIAVNGAIAWLPVAHSWFTLDPDDRVRPLMARPRTGVHYYAAVPADYGRPDAHRRNHRAPAEPGITWLHRVTGDGYLSARATLSEDPGAIHTGNSAWGALGLAYHMCRQVLDHRIALLGVDADRGPYAFMSGRPRTPFDHLPALFESALPQLRARCIAVMNGSRRSRVACFTRCEPNAALDWLMS